MTARGRAIAAALAFAKRVGQPVGRPPVGPLIAARVRALRREGKSFRAIAAEVGVGVGTVHRILAPRFRVRTRPFQNVAPGVNQKV